MKNVLRTALGLLLLSIVFMSCSKTTTSKKSYIKYDNKEYDLSQGAIFPGDFAGKKAAPAGVTLGNSIDLMLLSSGFTIHEIDGSVDSLSGTGSGIVFETYSGSSDKIDDGEYVFDSLSLAKPGTFSYADAVFDYNSATETGTEVEMNAGTLTVKTVGDEYEFTFSCKTYDGKTVTGYYKGSIKSYMTPVGKATKNGVQKLSGWDFRR
jgi:hypothetical protein